LGHLAVQYARVAGARVIAIDGGRSKASYLKDLGANHYLDYLGQSPLELVSEVQRITSGGAHAAIVTAGSSKAFTAAASMLRIEGNLCCCGIPPPSPDKRDFIEASIGEIVIKGLKIQGNLTGSLQECLEAVDLVRLGWIKPKVTVRKLQDLEQIYGELEAGKVEGRVVVKITDD